ncbi:RICIN domain-containing protein [Streptomyces sp. NWU339]|uniref:RICIN domain-containing protein n=1 Tax=Streptomyces sp. NWU339 TaxID=2185284 RepID=UPI0015E7FD26|nr:RICIN domain-containing protein [Streptomyces sp. NWU339]
MHGTRLRLVNGSSGRALTAVGRRVGQSWVSANRQREQLWRLHTTPQARHVFVIENAGSGLLLTASGEGDGAQAVLEPGPATHSQHWRLAPLHAGQYALQNLASGKYLDLWDARSDDAAAVSQYDFWNGPQQRWMLRPVARRHSTRAVLTLIRDEPEFFPIWLDYYSRFFQPQDIYVLHHQPPHDLPADGRFVRIPVRQDVFGTQWQRDIVQQHQHDLIGRYDVVLCTDVDEIVAPDPRFCDLGAYIDQFDEQYVNCTGFEVLHLNDTEPAFDPAEKILTQRSTWFSNPLYSKPLLARVPMLWRGGFHERADYGTNHDPNLYLIHLHRMDYNICLKRHRRRKSHQRAQDDLDQGRGYQNRITSPDQFHRWFYNDQVNGKPFQPEPIPTHWQHVL